MPNWCQNRLSVSNLSDAFIDFLKDNGFSFQAILPIEKVKGIEENLVEQEALWGTKWDLDEEEFAQVAFELIENNVVEFNTAYSPPLGVIEALSEQFPEVDFKLDYFEVSCWFAGTFFASAGTSIDEPLNDDGDILALAKEVFEYESPEELDEDGVPVLQDDCITPCLSCQENNLFDVEDGE